MTDSITFGRFTMREKIDLEEDNRKIFHEVYENGKYIDFLDHSPYEMICERVFVAYISFYIKYGRFPTRRDNPNDSVGPLRNTDVMNLEPEEDTP